MARVKAWKKGAVGEPGFPDDFEVVERAVLQRTDLTTNNNKYYGLELHRAGHSFRVFTHYGRTDDLEKNPDAGVRESRYFATEDEARDGYAAIYADKTRSTKGYKEVALASSRIGSRPTMDDDGSAAAKPAPQASSPKASSTLHPEVQALVNLVYAEATSALTTTVTAKITAKGIETPLGVLELGQVQKGEAILAQLYAEFHKGQKRKSELTRLSGEFYSVIPHRLGRTRAAIEASVIDNIAAFEEKQQTLQLMRDMMSVQNVLFEADVDARAKALGCEIGFVEPKEARFSELADMVVKSQIKTKSVKVKNIFTVRRGGEHETFQSEIPNQRLLFHGSRIKNWAGILSRGLLMPKVAVQMGVHRSDEGWLGNGIYFGDAACASTFYTTPGKAGTRLMALALVALGEMKEYTRISYGLSAPPPGYHSCHGLRSRPGLRSQFEDDEYAVYQTNQQRLEYLVEFTA
jgi:poly [ADP-ribose] polymerase